MTTTKSLKSKVISSSIISVLGFGGTQGLRFVANLILARILFPEAFGIMAIVNVIDIGLTMFSDVGIHPAIIQSKRGEDHDFLNTAWTIQIVRGFVLWGVACLIAWPASVIYGQEILFPLISISGLIAVMDGFQSTAVATAPRKLQLGRLTLVRTVGQFIGILVMIVLAWLYQSVWSLIIGTLVGTFAETILGHLFLPSHKHKLHFELRAARELFNFGQWIFLATLVTFLGSHGLRAIQGLYVSTHTLGLISIAAALAGVFLEVTHHLASSVIFPTLSHIARERKGDVGSTIMKIRKRLLLLTLPGFVALSLASGLIVSILYDERYVDVAQYMAILSIGGALETLAIGFNHAYLALGNSHIHFRLTVLSTLARILCMIAGFHMGGVIGMLFGLTIGALCAYLFSLAFAHKSGWINPLHEAASLAFIAIGAALSWNLHGLV